MPLSQINWRSRLPGCSVCETHDPTGEPSAVNPPARFGERRLETEPRRGVRHRHCESRRQQLPPSAYRYRASRRLYGEILESLARSKQRRRRSPLTRGLGGYASGSPAARAHVFAHRVPIHLEPLYCCQQLTGSARNSRQNLGSYCPFPRRPARLRQRKATATANRAPRPALKVVNRLLLESSLRRRRVSLPFEVAPCPASAGSATRRATAAAQWRRSY